MTTSTDKFNNYILEQRRHLLTDTYPNRIAQPWIRCSNIEIVNEIEGDMLTRSRCRKRDSPTSLLATATGPGTGGPLFYCSQPDSNGDEDCGYGRPRNKFFLGDANCAHSYYFLCEKPWKEVLETKGINRQFPCLFLSLLKYQVRANRRNPAEKAKHLTYNDRKNRWYYRNRPIRLHFSSLGSRCLCYHKNKDTFINTYLKLLSSCIFVSIRVETY